MIIDWYTIIFQIINFLILVFLLRRFLYGPIIRAMDQRENTIVEREEKAAREKEEAEKEARQYRQQKDELERQEDEIIEEAREKAEQEKRKLVNEAREEVEETRRRWKEAFEREKETFIVELRRRIGQQACLVARRCLEDLADSHLEELTWDQFLEKVQSLPEKELTAFKDALTSDDGKVVLLSAFEAPEEKIEQLQQFLQKMRDDSEEEVQLEMKNDQKLICGLELITGGYRVAWSIDSYLEDVEAEILKDLESDAPGAADGEVIGSDEREE